MFTLSKTFEVKKFNGKFSYSTMLPSMGNRAQSRMTAKELMVNRTKPPPCLRTLARQVSTMQLMQDLMTITVRQLLALSMSKLCLPPRKAGSYEATVQQLLRVLAASIEV